MQVATTIDGDSGMVVKRLSVPIGLEELMESLTKQVLLKKPKDVYSFASSHFSNLLSIRNQNYSEPNSRKNSKSNNAARDSLKIKSATVATKFNKLPTPIIFTNSKSTYRSSPNRFSSSSTRKASKTSVDVSPRSLDRSTNTRSSSSEASQKNEAPVQGRAGRARWKKQEPMKKGEKLPLERAGNLPGGKKNGSPKKAQKPDEVEKKDIGKPPLKDRSKARKVAPKAEEGSNQKDSDNKKDLMKKRSLSREKPISRDSKLTPRRSLSKSSSGDDDISVKGSQVNLNNKKTKKSAKTAEKVVIAAAAAAPAAAIAALAAKGIKVPTDVELINEINLEKTEQQFISCPEKTESTNESTGNVDVSKVQIKDDAVDSDFVDDDKESAVIENVDYVRQEVSHDNDDTPHDKSETVEPLENISESDKDKISSDVDANNVANDQKTPGETIEEHTGDTNGNTDASKLAGVDAERDNEDIGIDEVDTEKEPASSGLEEGIGATADTNQDPNAIAESPEKSKSGSLKTADESKEVLEPTDENVQSLSPKDADGSKDESENSPNIEATVADDANDSLKEAENAKSDVTEENQTPVEAAGDLVSAGEANVETNLIADDKNERSTSSVEVDTPNEIGNSPKEAENANEIGDSSKEAENAKTDVTEQNQIPAEAASGLVSAGEANEVTHLITDDKNEQSTSSVEVDTPNEIGDSPKEAENAKTDVTEQNQTPAASGLVSAGEANEETNLIADDKNERSTSSVQVSPTGDKDGGNLEHENQTPEASSTSVLDGKSTDLAAIEQDDNSAHDSPSENKEDDHLKEVLEESAASPTKGASVDDEKQTSEASLDSSAAKTYNADEKNHMTEAAKTYNADEKNNLTEADPASKPDTDEDLKDASLTGVEENAKLAQDEEIKDVLLNTVQESKDEGSKSDEKVRDILLKSANSVIEEDAKNDEEIKNVLIEGMEDNGEVEEAAKPISTATTGNNGDNEDAGLPSNLQHLTTNFLAAEKQTHEDQRVLSATDSADADKVGGNEEHVDGVEKGADEVGATEEKENDEDTGKSEDKHVMSASCPEITVDKVEGGGEPVEGISKAASPVDDDGPLQLEDISKYLKRKDSESSEGAKPFEITDEAKNDGANEAATEENNIDADRSQSVKGFKITDEAKNDEGDGAATDEDKIVSEATENGKSAASFKITDEAKNDEEDDIPIDDDNVVSHGTENSKSATSFKITDEAKNDEDDEIPIDDDNVANETTDNNKSPMGFKITDEAKNDVEDGIPIDDDKVASQGTENSKSATSFKITDEAKNDEEDDIPIDDDKVVSQGTENSKSATSFKITDEAKNDEEDDIPIDDDNIVNEATDNNKSPTGFKITDEAKNDEEDDIAIDDAKIASQGTENSRRARSLKITDEAKNDEEDDIPIDDDKIVSQGTENSRRARSLKSTDETKNDEEDDIPIDDDKVVSQGTENNKSATSFKITDEAKNDEEDDIPIDDDNVNEATDDNKSAMGFKITDEAKNDEEDDIDIDNDKVASQGTQNSKSATSFKITDEAKKDEEDEIPIDDDNIVNEATDNNKSPKGFKITDEAKNDEEDDIAIDDDKVVSQGTENRRSTRSLKITDDAKNDEEDNIPIDDDNVNEATDDNKSAMGFKITDEAKNDEDDIPIDDDKVVSQGTENSRSARCLKITDEAKNNEEDEIPIDDDNVVNEATDNNKSPMGFKITDEAKNDEGDGIPIDDDNVVSEAPENNKSSLSLKITDEAKNNEGDGIPIDDDNVVNAAADNNKSAMGFKITDEAKSDEGDGIAIDDDNVVSQGTDKSKSATSFKITDEANNDEEDDIPIDDDKVVSQGTENSKSATSFKITDEAKNDEGDDIPIDDDKVASQGTENSKSATSFKITDEAKNDEKDEIPIDDDNVVSEATANSKSARRFKITDEAKKDEQDGIDIDDDNVATEATENNKSHMGFKITDEAKNDEGDGIAIDDDIVGSQATDNSKSVKPFKITDEAEKDEADMMNTDENRGVGSKDVHEVEPKRDEATDSSASKANSAGKIGAVLGAASAAVVGASAVQKASESSKEKPKSGSKALDDLSKNFVNHERENYSDHGYQRRDSNKEESASTAEDNTEDQVDSIVTEASVKSDTPDFFGQSVKPSVSEPEALSAFPQNAAATKIQSMWRGHKTRKLNREQQPDNLQSSEVFQALAGNDAAKAATVIQAFIRGHQVRKQYRHDNNEALHSNDELPPVIEEGDEYGEEHDKKLSEDEVSSALKKLDQITVPADEPEVHDRRKRSLTDDPNRIYIPLKGDLDTINNDDQTKNDDLNKIEESEDNSHAPNISEKQNDSDVTDTADDNDDSKKSLLDSISDKLTGLKNKIIGQKDDPEELQMESVLQTELTTDEARNQQVEDDAKQDNPSTKMSNVTNQVVESKESDSDAIPNNAEPSKNDEANDAIDPKSANDATEAANDNENSGTGKSSIIDNISRKMSGIKSFFKGDSAKARKSAKTDKGKKGGDSDEEIKGAFLGKASENDNFGNEAASDDTTKDDVENREVPNEETSKAINDQSDALKVGIEGVKGASEDQVDSVKSKSATDALEQTSAEVNDDADDAKDAVDSSHLHDDAKSVIDDAKEGASALVSDGGETIEGGITSVKDDAKELSDQSNEKLENAANDISDSAKELSDQSNEKLENATNDITDGAKNIIEGFKHDNVDAIELTNEDINKALVETAEDIKEEGNKLLDGIEELKKDTEDLDEKIKGQAEGLADDINTTNGHVNDDVNALQQHVEDLGKTLEAEAEDINKETEKFNLDVKAGLDILDQSNEDLGKALTIQADKINDQEKIIQGEAKNLEDNIEDIDNTLTDLTTKDANEAVEQKIDDLNKQLDNKSEDISKSLDSIAKEINEATENLAQDINTDLDTIEQKTDDTCEDGKNLVEEVASLGHKSADALENITAIGNTSNATNEDDESNKSKDTLSSAKSNASDRKSPALSDKDDESNKSKYTLSSAKSNASDRKSPALSDNDDESNKSKDILSSRKSNASDRKSPALPGKDDESNKSKDTLSRAKSNASDRKSPALLGEDDESNKSKDTLSSAKSIASDRKSPALSDKDDESIKLKDTLSSGKSNTSDRKSPGISGEDGTYFELSVGKDADNDAAPQHLKKIDGAEAQSPKGGLEEGKVEEKSPEGELEQRKLVESKEQSPDTGLEERSTSGINEVVSASNDHNMIVGDDQHGKIAQDTSAADANIGTTNDHTADDKHIKAGHSESADGDKVQSENIDEARKSLNAIEKPEALEDTKIANVEEENKVTGGIDETSISEENNVAGQNTLEDVDDAKLDNNEGDNVKIVKKREVGSYEEADNETESISTSTSTSKTDDLNEKRDLTSEEVHSNESTTGSKAINDSINGTDSKQADDISTGSAEVANAVEGTISSAGAEKSAEVIGDTSAAHNEVDTSSDDKDLQNPSAASIGELNDTSANNNNTADILPNSAENDENLLNSKPEHDVTLKPEIKEESDEKKTIIPSDIETNDKTDKSAPTSASESNYIGKDEIKSLIAGNGITDDNTSTEKLSNDNPVNTQDFTLDESGTDDVGNELENLNITDKTAATESSNEVDEADNTKTNDNDGVREIIIKKKIVSKDGSLASNEDLERSAESKDSNNDNDTPSVHGDSLANEKLNDDSQEQIEPSGDSNTTLQDLKDDVDSKDIITDQTPDITEKSPIDLNTLEEGEAPVDNLHIDLKVTDEENSAPTTAEITTGTHSTNDLKSDAEKDQVSNTEQDVLKLDADNDQVSNTKQDDLKLDTDNGQESNTEQDDLKLDADNDQVSNTEQDDLKLDADNDEVSNKKQDDFKSNADNDQVSNTEQDAPANIDSSHDKLKNSDGDSGKIEDSDSKTAEPDHRSDQEEEADNLVNDMTAKHKNVIDADIPDEILKKDVESDKAEENGLQLPETHLNESEIAIDDTKSEDQNLDDTTATELVQDAEESKDGSGAKATDIDSDISTSESAAIKAKGSSDDDITAKSDDGESNAVKANIGKNDVAKTLEGEEDGAAIKTKGSSDEDIAAKSDDGESTAVKAIGENDAAKTLEGEKYDANESDAAKTLEGEKDGANENDDENDVPKLSISELDVDKSVDGVNDAIAATDNETHGANVVDSRENAAKIVDNDVENCHADLSDNDNKGDKIIDKNDAAQATEYDKVSTKDSDDANTSDDKLVADEMPDSISGKPEKAGAEFLVGGIAAANILHGIKKSSHIDKDDDKNEDSLEAHVGSEGHVRVARSLQPDEFLSKVEDNNNESQAEIPSGADTTDEEIDNKIGAASKTTPKTTEKIENSQSDDAKEVSESSAKTASNDSSVKTDTKSIKQEGSLGTEVPTDNAEIVKPTDEVVKEVTPINEAGSENADKQEEDDHEIPIEPVTSLNIANSQHTHDKELQDQKLTNDTQQNANKIEEEESPPASSTQILKDSALEEKQDEQIQGENTSLNINKDSGDTTKKSSLDDSKDSEMNNEDVTGSIAATDSNTNEGNIKEEGMTKADDNLNKSESIINDQASTPTHENTEINNYHDGFLKPADVDSGLHSDREDTSLATSDIDDSENETKEILNQIKNDLHHMKSLIEDEHGTNDHLLHELHTASSAATRIGGVEDKAHPLGDETNAQDYHRSVSEQSAATDKSHDDASSFDRLTSVSSTNSLDSAVTVILTEDLNKLSKENSKESEKSVAGDNDSSENVTVVTDGKNDEGLKRGKLNDKPEMKGDSLKPGKLATPGFQSMSIEEQEVKSKKIEKCYSSESDGNNNEQNLTADKSELLADVIAAATKIQSLFRGYKVRSKRDTTEVTDKEKEMNDKNEIISGAIAKIEAQQSDELEKIISGSGKNEEDAAATKIQTVVKEFLAKRRKESDVRKVADENAAAIKIQKLFKSLVSKKLDDSKKSDVISGNSEVLTPKVAQTTVESAVGYRGKSADMGDGVVQPAVESRINSGIKVVAKADDDARLKSASSGRASKNLSRQKNAESESPINSRYSSAGSNEKRSPLESVATSRSSSAKNGLITKKPSLNDFMRSLADSKPEIVEKSGPKKGDLDKLKAKSEEIENTVKSSIEDLENMSKEIDGNANAHEPFYLHDPEANTDNPISAAIRVTSKATNQQPSIGLLHSGEYHDTIPLNFSPTNIQVLVQDHRSAPTSPHSPPILLHSGEMHDASLLLPQTGDAPAGAAPVTSVSVGGGAQASDKEDQARSPSGEVDVGADVESVSDMDGKRNNASIVEKNTESNAATKIQASFRGYQVRKQMKTKNGGDITSPRRTSRRKSSGKVIDSSKGTTKKDSGELEERSATKIQAGIRGFLVRRRHQKNKNDP